MVVYSIVKRLTQSRHPHVSVTGLHPRSHPTYPAESNAMAGASIAINGACLTVAGIVEKGGELLIEFDVMQVQYTANALFNY